MLQFLLSRIPQNKAIRDLATVAAKKDLSPRGSTWTARRNESGENTISNASDSKILGIVPSLSV